MGWWDGDPNAPEMGKQFGVARRLRQQMNEVVAKERGKPPKNFKQEHFMRVESEPIL